MNFCGVLTVLRSETRRYTNRQNDRFNLEADTSRALNSVKLTTEKKSVSQRRFLIVKARLAVFIFNADSGVRHGFEAFFRNWQA
jgi:hypothetical protein